MNSLFVLATNIYHCPECGHDLIVFGDQYKCSKWNCGKVYTKELYRRIVESRKDK